MKSRSSLILPAFEGKVFSKKDLQTRLSQMAKAAEDGLRYQAGSVSPEERGFYQEHLTEVRRTHRVFKALIAEYFR